MSSGQLSKRNKARGRPSSEGSAAGISVKRLHAANDNLTAKTRAVWQSRLGRDLSTEDVRQIEENVVGFFTILAEWSKVETLAAGNDNNQSDEARDEG